MPWFVLRLLALKSWLLSRKRTCVAKPVGVGIFSVFSLFLLGISPVHAQSTTGSILNTDRILQLIAELAFDTAASITKIIVLLIDTMVPIMTYNNFVGNPVVKAGWAIVRDTVNMFFVVILIIIAFGTIFGNERFKWQQQVPRLLIMAIVVNFSKTLCGIMIDFGQVIMLTFANALREIAAGNFIQLLGLNQIYSVSQSSTVVTSIQQEGGAGAGSAFDFFAAGVASILLVVWVLATLVIMLAILLFRIIMLWVLVVIAPLAWFMKGAKGIIDSNAYEEWWKEFKCLVGIGPVLAFFLWLTLAVAGAGNIAANSGFNVSADSNNADFTSSLLELNNFLSFLIGMAMLFAGFKAASQFCSAGVSGGFIGKGVGMAKSGALQLSAAGLALKAGGVGARLGGRLASKSPGALSTVGRNLPGSVFAGKVASTLNVPKHARNLTLAAGSRTFGNTAVGRYFKGKQADVALQSRATQFDGVNKEKDAMKDKDRNWKQGQIEAMLKSPPMSKAGQDKFAALFEEVMGDKRLQKELGRDKVEALWKSQGANYKEMAKGNAQKTSDIEGFEKSNADFVLRGMTGDQKREWLEKNIRNADDAKGLSAASWEDEAVRGRTARISTTLKKDGRSLSALEAAREGHYEDEVRKAIVRGTNVEGLEGAQVEAQFKAALDVGDRASAETVIADIERRYSDPNTSTEDRARLSRSMDRMRVVGERMNSTASRGAVSTLTTARGRMETTMGPGLPPVPSQQDDIDRYVQFNFAQSSGGRIDAAMNQMTTAGNQAQQAKTALEEQLNQFTGPQKEVADKQREITETRSRLYRDMETRIASARTAFSNAERQFRNAERLKNEGRMSEDDFNYEEGLYKRAQTALNNTKKKENQKISKSSELKNLDRELQRLVDAAGGDTAVAEATQRAQEHRNVQEQIDRLEQTRARLQEERNRRTV